MKASSERHTNRTPPIPSEILERRLKEIGIDELTCRRLLRDQVFKSLRCRNHQISYKNSFFKEQDGKAIPIFILEQVFCVTETGRQIEINENVEDIFQINMQEENDGTPMKPKEEVIFSSDLSNLPLTKGWLQTFLIRKSEEI